MTSTTIIELDTLPYFREFYFDFGECLNIYSKFEDFNCITRFHVAEQFSQVYTKSVNTEPSGILLPCKKYGQYLFNTNDEKTANFLIKNKGFYMNLLNKKQHEKVWVAANRKLEATERTITIKGTKTGILSSMSNSWFDNYLSEYGRIVDKTEEVFLQHRQNQLLHLQQQESTTTTTPFTTLPIKNGFRTAIVDVHTPIPLNHKVQIKTKRKTIEACFQIVYNENNPSSKKKAKTEITKKSTPPSVGSPPPPSVGSPPPSPEENLQGTKHLPLEEIRPPSGGTFPPSGGASPSSGKPLPQPPIPPSSGIGPSTTTSTAAAKVKNQRSPGSNVETTSSAAFAAATTAADRAAVSRSVVSHSVAAAASAAASPAANLAGNHDANKRSKNERPLFSSVVQNKEKSYEKMDQEYKSLKVKQLVPKPKPKYRRNIWEVKI